MSNGSGNSETTFITAGDSGHAFDVFWHPGQPDRIHYGDERPGLH